MVRPSTVSGSVSGNRHVPRAPSHALGVTRGVEMSRISSEGVAPPSSLIRTHAPDQNPPYRFRSPYTEGLCRLLSAPAGRWPFPTLSPQSVSRRLDPYPAAFLATLSVWTRSQDTGLAPVLTSSARENLPAMQLQQGGAFRGCSHSLMFRLPYLLGPPIAPAAVPSTGQPGRLRHAMNMWLPT